MSTELAITAVTSTLVKLLEDEVADKWGPDVLSGNLTKERVITALRPNRVRERYPESNVLNLFLYRTEVSAAYRNFSPPGQAGSPPLGLNLEYLVSAYGEVTGKRWPISSSDRRAGSSTISRSSRGRTSSTS